MFQEEKLILRLICPAVFISLQRFLKAFESRQDTKDQNKHTFCHCKRVNSGRGKIIKMCYIDTILTIHVQEFFLNHCFLKGRHPKGVIQELQHEPLIDAQSPSSPHHTALNLKEFTYTQCDIIQCNTTSCGPKHEITRVKSTSLTHCQQKTQHYKLHKDTFLQGCCAGFRVCTCT